MCAINDPLGKTHSPAIFFRDFEKWGRTDIQTPHVKIVITTGRDCWIASWINNSNFFITCQKWSLKSLFNCILFDI